MVMGRIEWPMEINMWEVGRMGSNMDVERLFIPVASNMLVNGKKYNGQSISAIRGDLS